MRPRSLPILIFALMLAAGAYGKGQEVKFRSADGVTVYGDLYRMPDRPLSAPLVLLFHQGGGDARGEYIPLVSRIVHAGYHALAIDQRRGGDRFGMPNRTATEFGDQGGSYCDAYPDLEAALAYADELGFTGPRIAWGSSYSAALAIRLGAEHPGEIDAVLAFSPASGNAMEGCRPEPYAEQLKRPLLALRPVGEMEVEYVPKQLELFQSLGHQTYVADPGVHGSSMLNPGRVGAPTDATWAVVLEFIARSLARE